MTLEGARICLLPERVALASAARLEMLNTSLPTFKDEIYIVYRVDCLKGIAGTEAIEAAKKALA